MSGSAIGPGEGGRSDCCGGRQRQRAGGGDSARRASSVAPAHFRALAPFSLSVPAWCTVDGHLRPRLGLAGGPCHSHWCGLRGVAQSHQDPRVVGRGIAAVGRARRHERSRPSATTSTRAPSMSRPAGSDQPQAEPVMAVADLVDEQARRPVVVADEHVHVAVVVDVAKRRAAADLRQRERGARRGRVTSSKRPSPRLRNSSFRWCSGNGSLRLPQRLDDLHACRSPTAGRASRRCRSRTRPCRSR